MCCDAVAARRQRRLRTGKRCHEFHLTQERYATERRSFAMGSAATLKGKELKDVLQERNFPALDIKLLDDDESLGQLDAVGEEPTFIQSVRPEHFDRVDFTFFASEPDFTRRHW